MDSSGIFKRYSNIRNSPSTHKPEVHYVLKPIKQFLQRRLILLNPHLMHFAFQP